MDGSNPGTLMTVFGNSTGASTDIVIEHNTSFTGLQGGTIDETGAGTAGAVSGYRANLFWNSGAPVGSQLGYGKYVATFGNGVTSDICSPANADFNWGWNLNQTTTETTFTHSGNGYLSNQSSAPVQHDVDVLAGQTCALNPQFVNQGANFAKWGQSVGQSGTYPSATLWNNTTAYLQTNLTTRIPQLIAYVRAGNRPTNSAGNNASFPSDPSTTDAAGNVWPDGGPGVGAMAWQAPGGPWPFFYDTELSGGLFQGSL